MAPPTVAEQAATISRQQAEIVALRELCATQASAIEQLRHAANACFSAAAPGTSPPPPYGPASPSTELASSGDDFDADLSSPSASACHKPPHPSHAATSTVQPALQ